MKQEEVIQMLKEVIDKTDLMTAAERELDFLVADLQQENAALREVNEGLLLTMRQLACLGNGDQYGNSDGNIIAQVALNKATGESE